MMSEAQKRQWKEFQTAGTAASTTHGMSYTKEYKSWKGARNRCNNPRNPHYPNYGGRGIEFRFESFEEFYAYLGPKPPESFLDRIDNDGHYESGNVRWATLVQSQNNRRNVRLNSAQRTRILCLIASGFRHNDIASEFGVSRAVVSQTARKLVRG